MTMQAPARTMRDRVEALRTFGLIRNFTRDYATLEHAGCRRHRRNA